MLLGVASTSSGEPRSRDDDPTDLPTTGRWQELQAPVAVGACMHRGAPPCETQSRSGKATGSAE